MATQGTEITFKVGDVYKSTNGDYYEVLAVLGEQLEVNIHTHSEVESNTLTFDYKFITKLLRGAINRGTIYRSSPEKLALFILTNGKVNKQ